MTIDRLAEITASQFHAVDKRLDAIESTMKEGFGIVKESFAIVLDELRGLRDDVKQSRAASNVDYAMHQGKIKALEEDMKRVKAKVKL